MLDGNSDILLGNSYDPNLNLFSENIKNLDTTFLLPGKLHNFLDNSVTDWLILHLNIRSIKRSKFVKKNGAKFGKKKKILNRGLIGVHTSITVNEAIKTNLYFFKKKYLQHKKHKTSKNWLTK